MAKKKNTNEKDNVTLFAAIPEKQYEGLRAVAFKEKKSLAQVTRDAIDGYLKRKIKGYPASLESDAILSLVIK